MSVRFSEPIEVSTVLMHKLKNPLKMQMQHTRKETTTTTQWRCQDLAVSPFEVKMWKSKEENGEFKYTEMSSQSPIIYSEPSASKYSAVACSFHCARRSPHFANHFISLLFANTLCCVCLYLPTIRLVFTLKLTRHTQNQFQIDSTIR